MLGASAMASTTAPTRVARGGGAAAGEMGAAVRPLRRGASAWGARRRARGRVVAAATAPRDDDAEDAEVDDASRREEADRRRARATILSAGANGRAGSASTMNWSLLGRAGQAAVVTAATMFAGAGVAHAGTTIKEETARGGAGTSSAAVANRGGRLGTSGGATDLGMLLADASPEEEEARLKKLAEIRRIKAERAKSLQKGKKSASADAAAFDDLDDFDDDDDDEDVAASKKKGKSKKGKRGAGASPGEKKMTAAEEKKAARIAAAKERAFQMALERERAAMGIGAEEEAASPRAAAAASGAADAAAAEEGVLVSNAVAAPAEKKKGKGLKLPRMPGVGGKGGGDKVAVGGAGTEEGGGQNNAVTKFMKKLGLGGPRFVRNVNLAYVRDPFAVKGTTYRPTECSYNGFYALCETRRVTRVEYMPNMNSVKFFLRDTDEVFYANLPYDPTLYTMMISKGIDIVSRQYTPIELFIRTTFNVFTPVILTWFMWQLYYEMQNDSTEGTDLQNTGTAKTYESQPRTGMTMKDIAGIDVVREEMNELIAYLRDYQKFVAAGAVIPAGVLLCGPPGTGKTLLARCLAGEANVPFFAVAGTEFMEMFVGVGAARIRNLFQQARAVRPCIVFIDEFDSVAVRRKDASQAEQGNDEQVATINQLLTEMDGFGGNSGVMIFAATNRPHVIDPALIRPGRFDRVIEMPLPNRSARIDIIKLHASYDQIKEHIDPDLDYEYVAKQTAGFTGADLENLVRTTALRAAPMATKDSGRLADLGMFLNIIDEIRRSNVFKATGQGTIGDQDEIQENEKIRAMNPYLRDTVCTYFAAQTLTAMLAPNFDEIAKVKVFAGGEASGQIVYVPDEIGADGNAAVKLRQWYESKMTVLVAGQMAERYLYGPDNVSEFGTVDMKEATAMACEMVMMHGWSDLGPLCVLQDLSNEEKYLNQGKKSSKSNGMQRSPGKMIGIPPGKSIVGLRDRVIKPEEQTMFALGVSDEMDLLIANEVRKLYVKACQRAVAIMHDPKGTEMLFSIREALATTKEINGRNLMRVFDKAGLQRVDNFSTMDLRWGEDTGLFWDDFINSVWGDDPKKGRFWTEISRQWRKMTDREAMTAASLYPADGSPSDDAAPEWMRDWFMQRPELEDAKQMAYAPPKVLAGVRATQEAGGVDVSELGVAAEKSSAAWKKEEEQWLEENEGKDLGEDVEARLRAKDKLYAQGFDNVRFVGEEGEVEDEDASESEEGADGGAEKSP